MDKYSIKDFDRDFPDDDACLEWLKNLRWPEGISCKQCEVVTKHHRVKGRLCYACDRCGTHVYPQAGTILQDSRTPLRSWFHAMFLYGVTRTGISAAQLQREIGVTYKTAWRMFKEIRNMMNEDVLTLLGEVEVDESYFGGKDRNRHISKRSGKRGRGAGGKTPVFGMVERKGKVIATVVPDTTANTILPIVGQRVMPSSMIYSDEYPIYDGLKTRGYQHRRVHHAAGVYVDGNVSTNTLEGFWSLVKRGISGVNHAVSAKYLGGYINAYSFRWNHREEQTPMFRQILDRLASSGLKQP